MPVAYTARVKLGTQAQRIRAIEGLRDLLAHLPTFQSWPTNIAFSAADGTITVTLTKALDRAQLEHLGLNDDGVTTT